MARAHATPTRHAAKTTRNGPRTTGTYPTTRPRLARTVLADGGTTSDMKLPLIQHGMHGHPPLLDWVWMGCHAQVTNGLEFT